MKLTNLTISILSVAVLLLGLASLQQTSTQQAFDAEMLRFQKSTHERLDRLEGRTIHKVDHEVAVDPFLRGTQWGDTEDNRGDK